MSFLRRRRDDCRRTPGLIDRLVEERASDEDRRHAATCAPCGAAMARAARFHDELQQSAQQLIAEDLPPGILDPELNRQVGRVVGLRSVGSGALAGVAALAVVVFATVVGIRPVLMPGSSPTQPSLQQVGGPSATPRPGVPLFSLGELTVALTERLHFQCGTDEPPQTGAGAGRASAVCTAPADAGPYTATVLLESSDSGTVQQVTITARILDLPGETSVDAQRKRDLVGLALARVTSEAFTGERPGATAANWVFAKVSQIAGPAWAMGIDAGGVRVDVQREVDGYLVHLSVTS